MTTSTVTGFETDWARWHSTREDNLRDPLGFLSRTGLHWLTDEPSRLPGVPGTWWVTDDKVFITAQPGDRLVAEGNDIAGVRILVPAEGAPGLYVRHERRVLEVIRRSGRHGVRVHDPAAPTLARFTGIPAYSPDPRWVVRGRFTSYPAPRPITTGAVLDGLEHRHKAVGEIEFGIGSVTERLVVFRTGVELLVLFTDATSGITTFPTARSLTLPTPDATGELTLDFNRAVNPPRAFTEFAACPVAPAQNRLRVAIEAGEQDPRLDRGPR